jgi:mannose-6-phosphate isomerase-like protein (cupin superfamily)
MGQVLHGSATTTETVRRAIQNSQASIRSLARRSENTCGSNPGRTHHSYKEIFVILEGDIEVIVDGEMNRVGKGNIVIIPPNTW